MEMQIMTPHWYQLVTENETPMGSITKVKLDINADVDDFRDAVKEKNAVRLKEVDAGELTVYENMAAYENRETVEHLEEDTVVDGYGDSKKNVLVVVVPNKTQGIEID
jgi:hypothetical protein